MNEKLNLDEIKARCEAATPGPWIWEANKTHSVKLYTPKNGECTVMDFVRRGMQDAQPRFSDRGNVPLGGIMHDADEIDLRENPDAMFIAHARQDIPVLVAEVERLNDENNKYLELLGEWLTVYPQTQWHLEMLRKTRNAMKKGGVK